MPTEAELITRLQAALPDVAAHIVGKEATMLGVAMRHLDSLVPWIKRTAITLEQGVSAYTAPAEMTEISRLEWSGRYQGNPWDRGYIDQWPEGYFNDGSLMVSPSPTFAQIAKIGAEAVLFYHCPRAFADLSDFQVDLVIMRASAEAMLVEAVRKSTKPVQLRDGHSSAPKNSTPSALYDALMVAFKEGCYG